MIRDFDWFDLIKWESRVEGEKHALRGSQSASNLVNPPFAQLHHCSLAFGRIVNRTIGLSEVATFVVMSKSEACLKLGQRISSLRKRKGLTLEKLAYEVGISKGNLSNIENGKRDPRFSTLSAIADGLGLTLGQLLKDADARVHSLSLIIGHEGIRWRVYANVSV